VRRMRVLPLIAILAASLGLGRREAQSADGVGIAASWQGLELTLTLPKQSYPRNALVLAALRLVNTGVRAPHRPGVRTSASVACIGRVGQPFGGESRLRGALSPHRPFRCWCGSGTLPQLRAGASSANTTGWETMAHI
jgi:hypothetical protein